MTIVSNKNTISKRDKEVILMALKRGDNLNLNQATEELAELIVAINHYRRKRITEVELIDEIADCEIILDLLKLIVARNTRCIYEVSDAVVKTRRKEKIDRLEKRIIDDTLHSR